MKKTRKILLMAACAVLLVCISVGATVAYLTSTDSVTNTFTVGKVKITLDEAKTDINGVVDVAATSRVKANMYKLMPGHEYVKDPTVHVTANSENCWVFVKVENGISAFEAATVENGYTNIADQIKENGWTELTGVTGVTGVYYQEYTQSATVTNLVVFNKFKVSDTADAVNGWASVSEATTKVTVTAYAIQKDGFTTPAAAWDEVKNK
jgi:predicted ribosomally synthesized peptide with SipW-like signal peptide